MKNYKKLAVEFINDSGEELHGSESVGCERCLSIRNFAAWLELNENKVIEIVFKECWECDKKPGSPVLCNQCLWVRDNYKG